MVTLNYKNFTAKIDPLGAELIELRKDGKNRLWCRDASVWGSSAPILFPICGRLREGKYTFDGSEYSLAPHGFAKEMLFETELIGNHRAVFTLQSSEDTVKQYPFTFKLSISYELCDEGLNCEIQVTNPAETPLYFSLGGHWSFALDELLDAYSLHFDEEVTLDREILDGAFISGAQERIITDSKILPLSYRLCDNDTYVFKNVPNACTLYHGEVPVARLEYPDTPHLLLWTLPSQKYLCIEPWNGMPDGAESGDLSKKDSICTLDGGKSKSFTHKILYY